MKKTSALATVFMAVIFLFNAATFFGCGKQNDSKDIDTTKTQLVIGYKNDGYGPIWMREAELMFEKKFAETSFEEGKKGVQVWTTFGTQEFNGWTFFNSYRSREEDLYIGATIWPQMNADENHMVDLTELAKEPLTEFGESESIYDKVHEWVKDEYQWDEHGVWSVAPGESYFGQTVYDVDLFEERKYYMKEGGGWTGTESEKTVGFDGIKGTFDDGLPTTEKEFFTLLDVIKSRGDIPFTWTGVNDAYSIAWALHTFLNYDDGAAQKIWNTGYGDYTLIHKNPDGTYSPDAAPTTFDGAKNFYENARFPGKLAAIKSAYNLVKGKNEGYYSSEVFKTTQTHIEAQNEYLMSVIADQRIAMLIEGSWWEMEADDTFTRMAKDDGSYSKHSRRFGVMPPIKPAGNTATKHTFLAAQQGAWIPTRTKTGNSGTFEACKKFIKMLASDELLNAYTKATNIPAAYDYKVADGTYEALTYYGKQLYEISTNASGKINFVSENRDYHPAYLYNDAKYPYAFSCNINDPNSFVDSLASVAKFFKFDNNKKTAENYFDSMYEYACGTYDREYASNFGKR